MFDALVNAFRAPDIRRRILFVLGMLVIYRCLAHVPVPGVNVAAVQSVLDQNRLPAAAQPLLGRRPVELLDRRPGRQPVHQRLDHHAAHDGRRAPPPEPLARGRVRPQQDQPVHALPDGAAGASCRPTATWRCSPRTATGGDPAISNFDFTSLETLDADHHPDRGHHAGHVDRRADHRARHRQRHQLHHLRRHRRPHPAGASAPS